MNHLTKMEIPTRLSNQPVSVELAKFNTLTRWNPKIGDFIVWHGWFRHWYGVVNDISTVGSLWVIRENLPKLLFSLPMSERSKNSIQVDIDKIRGSRAGEYAVLQDGLWYVDD